MRQIVLAGFLSLVALAPSSLGETVALKTIKRIYVEKMANDFDHYIRAEITKKLTGRVLLVLQPEAADAVMAGISDHKSSTRAAASGSVSLFDKGGSVLWSSDEEDRNLWRGAMKRDGPRKVAERLVNNLKDALESNRVVELGPPTVANAALATSLPIADAPTYPGAPLGAQSPASGTASAAQAFSSTAGPTPAPAIGKTSTLVISSEASGSEIKMNGAFVGNTPMSLSVPPGLHRFEVTQGSQIWKREVQVYAGSAVSIHADFGAPVAVSHPQPMAQVLRIVCPENTLTVPFSSSRPDRRHLTCNEPITIMNESHKNWIRVRTADGVEGTVAARFVGM